MKLIASPELLRNPDVLGLASLCRELGASRIARWEGTKSTAYGFDKSGELDILETEWSTIMSLRAMGLMVHNATMYSPVVPRTTLDNKVPSDWPGAYITEDIVVGTEVIEVEELEPDTGQVIIYEKEVEVTEEQTRTKTWEEYTQVYDQGAEDCRVAYRGEPLGSNYKTLTDEDLQRWMDKFAGYCPVCTFNKWREVAEE